MAGGEGAFRGDMPDMILAFVEEGGYTFKRLERGFR